MTEPELDGIRRRIIAFCARHRVDPAECESIAQEVMYRIVRYREPIRNLKAWAVSCALNIVRTLHKNRMTFRRHAPVLWRRDAEAPEEELIRQEREAAVETMLAALTPKQRQAVERWLKKKDGEKVPVSCGRERAALVRAFVFFRERFPDARIFL